MYEPYEPKGLWYRFNDQDHFISEAELRACGHKFVARPETVNDYAQVIEPTPWYSLGFVVVDMKRRPGGVEYGERPVEPKYPEVGVPALTATQKRFIDQHLATHSRAIIGLAIGAKTNTVKVYVESIGLGPRAPITTSNGYKDALTLKEKWDKMQEGDVG